ncbi:MAG TPA: hypothetical protein VF864_15465, partial [Gemmatimonadales bacterium]
MVPLNGHAAGNGGHGQGKPTAAAGPLLLGDLTGRAYAQALKFGAQVMVAKGATRLACDGQRYTVE